MVQSFYMSFNLDKQATEVLFSRNVNPDNHPKLTLTVTKFSNAHLRNT